MKRLIKNYIFDKTAKTIACIDYDVIAPEGVLLITNVTTNEILYNFADATYGVSITDNVITLEYNTATMSNQDNIQIFYEDGKSEHEDFLDIKSGRLAVDVGNNPISIKGDANVPVSQMESGELQTFDTNLNKVFGSNSLITLDGKLLTQALPPDISAIRNIIGANSYLQLNIKNMGTAVIQLYGTWAGTITFEGTVTGADWVTISGYNINAATSFAGSSTTGGIFRFNVVGLSGIRARYSTYTSGTCSVFMVATAMTDDSITKQVSGSQSQPINQRATSYELNTYDTNLATVLGTSTTISPVAVPAIVVPTANTLQGVTAAPWAWKTPQYWARLRVETAGSERLPLKQIPYTNNVSVQDIPLFQIMEKLYIQMTLLSQALMNAKDIPYPDGWDLIK